MSLLRIIYKKQIFRKIITLVTVMVFTFQTTFLPMVQAQQKPQGKSTAKPSTSSPGGANVAPGGPKKTNVDLATGKVNLSIPLGSLGHPSSPGFSLSARYNSKTLAQYKVWNVEAPTNDTGVGWALSSHNSIVRYTNETGNENDDTFYWFRGGSGKELVYSHTDNTGDHYKPKHEMSNLTLVRTIGTDSTPGSWVMTATNGTKYIYGGALGKDARPPKQPKTPAEETLLKICKNIYADYTPGKYNGALDCDTGSVESVVTWGNWIGPSQQAKNQVNLETAWHLSGIEDLMGNQTTLSYVQVVQAVGPDAEAKRFSKAAYLYKVTQKNGQMLLLNYLPRGEGNAAGGNYAEYTDPWQINGEPDGYQERLRTLYVDSVDYYNAEKTRMSASKLEYSFLTSKDRDPHMAKRVLSGVEYFAVNHNNEAQEKLVSPPYKFAYWDSSDGVYITRSGENEKVFNSANGALYGAIKSVTSPKGAVTTYTYKANVLSPYNRKLELPEYLRDRKVFFGGDYALVVGSSTQASYVYTWTQNGWKGKEILPGIVPDCDPSPHNGVCKGVTLQKDFFAYVDKDGESYVVRRNKKNNLWLNPKKLGNDTYTIRVGYWESSFKKQCLTKGSDNVIHTIECDDLFYSKRELKLDKFADNGNSFKLQVPGIGYLNVNKDNKVIMGSDLNTRWIIYNTGKFNTLRKADELLCFSRLGGIVGMLRFQIGACSTAVPVQLQKNVDKITSTKDFIVLQGSSRILSAFSPSGDKIKLLNGVVGTEFGTVVTGPDYVVMGPDYSKADSTDVRAMIFDRKKKSFVGQESKVDTSLYYKAVGIQNFGKSCKEIESHDFANWDPRFLNIAEYEMYRNICDNVATKVTDNFEEKMEPLSQSLSDFSAYKQCFSGGKDYTVGMFVPFWTFDYGCEEIKDNFRLITTNPIVVSGRGTATQNFNNGHAYKTAIDHTGYRPIMISFHRDKTGLKSSLEIYKPPSLSKFGYGIALNGWGGTIPRTDIKTLWSSGNNFMGWIHSYKSLNAPSSISRINAAYCNFLTYNGSVWKSRSFLAEGTKNKNPDNCMSVSSLSNDFLFTTGGDGYRKFYYYDPKKREFVDTGNTHVTPQPKLKENKTKKAIELAEQLLGIFVMELGSLNIIGSFITLVFLGLRVAEMGLKNSLIAPNPLGLSFSKHFVMDGNTLWFRDTMNKSFNALGKLTDKTLYSQTFATTNSYIPFTTKENGTYKTYVRFLRNGTAGKTVLTSYGTTVSDTNDKFTTSSSSMFVSYVPNGDKRLSDSSGSWYLHRVIAENANRRITDYVVDQVQVKIGENIVKTGYKFNTSKVGFNGSGLYNEAWVYPGAIKDSKGNYTDAYGKTLHRFFTGAELSVLVKVCNESGSECKDVKSTELSSLLTGKHYQSFTYSKGASIPVYTSYTHYKINAGPNDTYRVLVDSVKRSKDGIAYWDAKTKEYAGVTKKISYTYNKRHQVSSKTMTNQIFDPVTKQTKEEISTATRVYAWEKYPEMAGKNMLAQGYMSYASKKVGSGKKVVRSSKLTTYKDWGNGVWLPESKYVTKKENPSTAINTDMTDYIKVGQVLERDAVYGMALKSQNIDGVVSQAWYSGDGQILPIASFSNANAAREGTGDAGYFGAESYETSLYLNNTVARDDLVPYTGKYAMKGKVKNWHVGPTKFSPDFTRRYIVSAWVYPHKGTTCSVGFGSNTSTSNTSSVWQYLEYTSNIGNTEKPKVTCDDPNSRVDDFRYGPLDSTFSATVFDPMRSVVDAHVGINGVTVHNSYDVFGELYLSYRDLGAGGKKKQFGGLTLQGWSEFGGFDKEMSSKGDEVAATAYGSLAAISIRSKEDLIYDNAIDIGSSELKGVMAGPRFVFHALASPAGGIGNPKIYIGEQGNPLLALEYDQSDRVFRLKQGGATHATSERLPKKAPDKITLVVIDQAAFVFANSKLVLTAQGLTPIPETNSSMHSVNYAMSHITFGKDPNIAMSYHDKAGRVTQAQALQPTADGKFETVINEIIYDGWGNAAVTTKSAAVSGLFKYRESFVQSFNWANGDISGNVVDYYKSGAGKAVLQGPNDYKYPYNRKTYDHSPLDRPKQTTSEPGDEFKIDGALTAIEEYRSDDDKQFMTHVGILDDKKYKFSSNTSKVPFSKTKRVLSQSISDTAGRSVAGRVGTASDGYIQTANEYEYNLGSGQNYVAGRVTNYQPNAFDDKGTLDPNTTYKTSGTVIDVLGRHAIGSVPDVEGKGHVFKDNAGRVRFTRVNPDWNEKKSQGFSYYKYDKLGRVIEKGVLRNVSGDIQFYLDKAHDANYPSAANACVNTVNIYDYARDITKPKSANVIQSTGYQGRLYATLTMNEDMSDKPTSSCSKASSPQKTIVENYYQYDVRGHISVRGTQRYKNTQLQEQSKSGYEYDNVGTLTKLVYPTKKSKAPSIKNMFDLSGQVAVYYSYDTLGRLKTISDSNDGTGVAYASNYKYTIDGAIESYKANDAKLSYNYVYDFQGRLRDIKVTKAQEEVFAEKLEYSPYQYGNPRTISYSGSGLGKKEHEYKYEYDIWGRLKQAVRKNKADKSTDEFSYAYDKNGYEYEYDIWGRLKQAVRKTKAGKSTNEFSYAYDKNGNILSEVKQQQSGGASSTSDTQKYEYTAGTNKLKKITTTSGDNKATKTRNFVHNSVGGITTMDGATGKSITFEREAKTDRILSMTQDGKKKVYEYDALGRRTSEQVDGAQVTKYYYGAGIQPLVEEVNGKQRLNIVGSHGLLAVVEGDEAYYAISDHLSSTRVVLKKDGSVAGGFEYDPYGKTSSIAGNDAKALEQFKVRYTGQRYDVETELYTFPARFMDPSVKRFLSIDPVPSEPSPYIYVGNNPITRVDPTGKSWSSWLWGKTKAAGSFIYRQRLSFGVAALELLSTYAFILMNTYASWNLGSMEIASRYNISYSEAQNITRPSSIYAQGEDITTVIRVDMIVATGVNILGLAFKYVQEASKRAMVDERKAGIINGPGQKKYWKVSVLKGVIVDGLALGLVLGIPGVQGTLTVMQVGQRVLVISSGFMMKLQYSHSVMTSNKSRNYNTLILEKYLVNRAIRGVQVGEDLIFMFVNEALYDSKVAMGTHAFMQMTLSALQGIRSAAFQKYLRMKTKDVSDTYYPIDEENADAEEPIEDSVNFILNGSGRSANQGRRGIMVNEPDIIELAPMSTPESVDTPYVSTETIDTFL